MTEVTFEKYQWTATDSHGRRVCFNSEQEGLDAVARWAREIDSAAEIAAADETVTAAAAAYAEARRVFQLASDVYSDARMDHRAEIDRIEEHIQGVTGARPVLSAMLRATIADIAANEEQTR